jgi:uncharacterized membrane protein
VATATAVATDFEKPTSILAHLVYPVSLLASLSIWLLAVRAPLWLDETLAYWQVSGGFWKIWSRSAQMPSSIGYLYTLWVAKSILGSQEIALKIPSTLAMLGAVYFLFRIARELFDQEIAFLTCIFFCLHSDVVFAATDARPYAFALLATNLTIFAFFLWMTRNQMKYAILFGAAAAGILYFHYLFGVILPAFAIYYLAVRGRSIKAEVRQLAAVLATFALLALPLVLRVASLYQTRQTHVIVEPPHTLVALMTFVPKKILIGFCITVFLAAMVRKVKLPGRDCFPAVLLCLLLALVPGGILYTISATTPMRLFIPRYCLVAVPGTALTWGLLTSRIDSRLLRQIFCAGLVAFTVYVSFASPYSRKHELTFKPALAFVNANVARDKAPVLICSGFIESNYQPMPAPTSENALVSQTSYYHLDAPTVLLPLDLNDETIRVASQTIMAAMQQRQRFLAVASPVSYQTLEWLASYTRGGFVARSLGEFDEILVVEFSPLMASD